MAYVELIKVNGLFEFIFYSKYVDEALVYDWLLGMHPNIFLEFEIHRVMDYQMIRSLQRTVRCLEDRPMFAKWIRVVAKCKCTLDDDVDNIFQKMFRDTYIRNFLIREYVDDRRVVYKTNLPKDDENFREILTVQMTNYELNLLKKRYIKQTFDAYCRESEESICHEYIKNLAQINNFIGCHWLIMYAVNSNSHAGEFIFRSLEDYKQLLKSFFFGYLNDEPDVVGIGSKKLSDGGICLAVYHKSFLYERDLFALDKAIRRSGILRRMKLKMDIYSVCQIRKGNEYGLRPTIYSSYYKLHGRYSVIETDYTRNYQPDVKFPEDVVWYNYL